MVHIPQISGLKANQILEETRKYKDIDDYMLILKKEIFQTETILTMSVWIRLCLTLIVNTLMLDVFQKMINDAKEQRREIIKKRNH